MSRSPVEVAAEAVVTRCMDSMPMYDAGQAAWRSWRKRLLDDVVALATNPPIPLDDFETWGEDAGKTTFRVPLARYLTCHVSRDGDHFVQDCHAYVTDRDGNRATAPSSAEFGALQDALAAQRAEVAKERDDG